MSASLLIAPHHCSYYIMFLSERWLVKKRKTEKALKTLAKIRRATVSSVKPELTEIEISLKDTSSANAVQTCKLLFCNRDRFQR